MRDVKKDFPLLQEKINEERIVYLDSAATSLKPQPVTASLQEYYSSYTANVFRGIYSISEKATAKYQEARTKVARFINASAEEEIIFVRSTTEAINLVAYSWGRMNIGEGDSIALTIMEHHSNFVPWQQLALESGAELRVIDVTDEGELDIYDNKRKVQNAKLKVAMENAKLFAITHVSNMLGAINPIREIIEKAKKINPRLLVIVDGAQAVPHAQVDVQELGCDFYAFSGHKMLGPTGIGVLWGKQELLEEMVPFNFGGEMIREVRLDSTRYKQPPLKFEAGTPHIAGAIGLGAAVDYLTRQGMENVREHELDLIKYALLRLKKLDDVQVYGPKDPQLRAGVVSFNLFDSKGKLIHPHDVAQVLDENNICIRSGHHCTQPLHARFNIPATARASFYLYNSKADVNELVKGLEKVREKLG